MLDRSLLGRALPPYDQIKINTDKCEVICFTWKDYGSVLREVLTIQGDRLRWTTTTRHLGMVLTKRLSTKVAATRRIQIGRAAHMSLAPLLRRSPPFTTSTKLLLYTSIIRPYNTYSGPVWYTTS
ncbi:hypothetical protein J6590_006860 [Homalodisca vitripennis]|nr:hypothetical protein J6590_006860 [Homalodisca vitripennis]